MDFSLLIALAAVATALFTGYAIVQRWLERPRPQWRVTRSKYANASTDPNSAWVQVYVENIGDGSAFDASASSASGFEFVFGDLKARQPVLDTGDSLALGIHFPFRSGLRRLDEHGNAVEFEINDASILGSTKVTVKWRQPPHRAWKRSKTYRVRKLEADRI